MGSLVQATGGQQITIFYSGSVIVYDNVPAHKVRAINMLLLSDPSNNNITTSCVTECGTDSSMQTLQLHLSGRAKASFPPPRPPTPYSTPTTDNAQITQFIKRQHPIISKRSQAELPFARKASLARFLEKRKDRVLEAVKANEDVGPCATEGDVEVLDGACKRMKD